MLTREQYDYLIRLEQQHRFKEAYMFLMGIVTGKVK
nr:MAG TPA: hypothetical protein [Caudoviricetes sp.]